MSKPIELSRGQWHRLKEQLTKDYPPSVMLLRTKMQSKLGFVDREYKHWDDNMGKYGGWRKNCIMLDFYSEKKRTFFLMKYSDYIQLEHVKDDF
jgi:hypothetical protein